MDAVHFLIFLVHWEVWLPSQAYGHRDFGYQVVANIHYKKWWQRYVRTWFDQAGRKQRRRKTRQEKAAAVAPRPTGGKLRPMVHGMTQRYNSKARTGAMRFFST